MVPKEILLDISEKFVRIRVPKNQEFCELKSLNQDLKDKMI
jgi:hypothetical protein